MEINIFILHHHMCFSSTELFGDEREDLLLPLVSVHFTGSNYSKSAIKQQNVLAQMMVYQDFFSLQLFYWATLLAICEHSTPAAQYGWTQVHGMNSGPRKQSPALLVPVLDHFYQLLPKQCEHQSICVPWLWESLTLPCLAAQVLF